MCAGVLEICVEEVKLFDGRFMSSWRDSPVVRWSSCLSAMAGTKSRCRQMQGYVNSVGDGGSGADVLVAVVPSCVVALIIMRNLLRV